MPSSSPHVIADVVHLVHTCPHRRVLDVGPGWGKYAVLLREYLNEKPDRIDAVEAWAGYVLEHRLDRLYDDVLVADVCRLPAEVLARYDVVLMVDVLEHLEDGEALDLLARIPGRIVISTPQAFFTNGEGLPPTEEHRSHWPRARMAKLPDLLGRPLEHLAVTAGGVLARFAPLP